VNVQSQGQYTDALRRTRYSRSNANRFASLFVSLVASLVASLFASLVASLFASLVASLFASLVASLVASLLVLQKEEEPQGRRHDNCRTTIGSNL